jgi:hypothetical protein
MTLDPVVGEAAESCIFWHQLSLHRSKMSPWSAETLVQRQQSLTLSDQGVMEAEPAAEEEAKAEQFQALPQTRCQMPRQGVRVTSLSQPLILRRSFRYQFSGERAEDLATPPACLQSDLVASVVEPRFGCTKAARSTP